MKKLILSATIATSLVALPFSGIAFNNPFSQLVRNAINPQYQDCGKTTDPGFCHCFTDALLTGCQHAPIHPKCTPDAIKKEIDAMRAQGKTYEQICRLEHSPVDPTVCAEDLQYWHDNYSTCNKP
ncbi:hypothetical protein [Coxiella burnetii]|uniref:Hypothetical exported protein n=1 Tax=Coxiella burnetii (strain RSA 493 / Nine Mile phase I) TaxID=227377 RepID=Q83AC0_COXBU|nr:hypothetical protein [Coxiella burnetii]NP_820959.1 hypothetical protein CBU_1984 [Coxiella burnetii RSA 493]AAO91473.1 hypothetical exported protein [Coxiella burnetii RSA 493]ABX78783.1 hypothetical protein COXBURSA331_A0101 [Coxiella burnetii RSA 331]ACJ19233.1 hypothetical exported protein [Coxiella burnetii CbuG_Q212]ACJ21134.1 hypothetical exported protein [Coxiella burnetii CbuK_Q154]AIT64207.1 putative exported protein [Coxiella burnetii str. Namibia]